jgi:hypothetical protein
MEIPKIQAHRKSFEEENPSTAEIARRLKENPPVGVLKEKWTKETIECPSCHQKALDKFTGGANVEAREISHTEFLYHCRVCDLNLTEEQCKNLVIS